MVQPGPLNLLHRSYGPGAWRMTEMVTIPGLISSFGEDEAGELYVCDISNGVIYRIVQAQS